jgi:hypothetical protein
MRKILALTIAAAAMFGTGAALADEADVTIPLSDADPSLADVYIDVETTQAYQESNGCDGLQTTATDCRGDDDLEDPDTALLVAPEAPEPPAVPLP